MGTLFSGISARPYSSRYPARQEDIKKSAYPYALAVFGPIRQAHGRKIQAAGQARSDRLLGRWHLHISFGAVFARIFGAHQFEPWSKGMPVGDCRRPRRREDIFVFHRDKQLQVLAAV